MNDPNDTAGGSSGTTWVYEYDRGGNMTAKKRYAYTTGTLGTVQQTVSYTYGDNNWKDKLTAYNGQTFTYDTIGNVKTAEGWTYAWMRGRYLMTITKGTAGTAGYEQHKFDYDHKGRCIGRTYIYYDTSRSKNVWRGYSYTWEGDRLVHLVTSNRVGDAGNYTTDETMHFHYDAQGKPSMLMYNGTRFGYVYNAQGDVIGIITGGLTEKVKYTYDAWGRLLSITGSSANTIGKANPFRYRAYIYDQECGLYYLRTRYYNPNWCRFINADNIFVGNLFAYCNNSPVQKNDQDGKWPQNGCVEAHGYVSEVAIIYDVSVIKGVCFDSHKNRAEFITYVGISPTDNPGDYAAGVAGVGATIAIVSQCYCADSVYDLIGMGSYVGGSVDIGLSLGFDAIFLKKTVAETTREETPIDGYQISFGLGFGLNWLHEGNSFTMIRLIEKEGVPVQTEDLKWLTKDPRNNP